ncbi:MAG TPA: hypothetical protein DEO70_13310 [Bacteroidales bacterium]|nr:MAG: hypothetical protein A2X11_09195 [Bacteroidetes bacterium GWE2_42_24]OFY26856.1 MAG: hypothetical protein A2X09_11110 [Bacteroidetes bacterium GWF2_43_11]PKP19556.1 MAG: hypothetical protein CVU06_11255 [Bacteroidetes bacterium HGW-Bacteroidetes-22]HBZ67806.1 hypothetical protein [Bacteroidales bacterium]
MKTIVEKLKKTNGSLLGKPASSAEIAAVSSKMQRTGFPEMPEELKKLLKIADGIFYNGIEIWPCDADNVHDPDFRPRSIMEVNKKMAMSSFSRKWPDSLIIGQSDEEIYCFSSRQNKYFIIDRTGFEAYYDFDDLKSLLIKVVDERLPE